LTPSQRRWHTDQTIIIIKKRIITMLLKIETGYQDNTMALLEVSEVISFTVEPQWMYDQQELEAFTMPRELVENIENQPFFTQLLTHKDIKHGVVNWQKYCVTLNQIRFLDGQDRLQVISFDGNAYLCNDSGQTIHGFKRETSLRAKATPSGAKGNGEEV
jgi:hypothetical protein